jgi:hypothetical protein
MFSRMAILKQCEDVQPDGNPEAMAMFVSRMAILKPMAMFVSLLAQVLLGCGQ